MRKLIILGSSRKNGDTRKTVDEIIKLSSWDLIDLTDYNIGYYDYEHKNLNDDYLPLMRKIIAEYDVLIFATPVYWYSMSGIMKVFFDRITDLLDEEKDLGRKLRGKSMAAVSCSVGDNLGENFWLPFRETAKYLGMNYLGNTHTIAEKDESENLQNFVRKIEEYKNL
ncbi:MAG: NAD(P)H-dependent oxidoreductase [Pyrinomonadaceae bacterium]|nr:NAD(P)H-dependent oxidoreductase [Pyrinomonadaceae bacterium]